MNTIQSSSPSSYELGCYVAIETSKEARDSWEVMVQTYTSSLSTTTQPNDSLGTHVQVLFNSSQAHYDRLARLVDKAKHRRHDDLAFAPVYSFHSYDKERFYQVLQAEAHKKRCSVYDNLIFYSSLFESYLNSITITTLDLDSAFNGRSYDLPKCIFTLRNVEVLSLRNNQLRKIPPDIARLQKLKVLRLSNNKLKNESIPYMLSHCKEITTLLLDYNSLDAVPGFVLELNKLETLHRHGNQNYFRTTFMWYGCEGRERIRTASFSDVDTASTALKCATNVQTLKFWAAKSVISNNSNYFLLADIPESTKDYISDVYKMFNICASCRTAHLLHSTGYFVFTFQNPYARNTCVPFQHWTCSRGCALGIEVPARNQQIMMARKQKKAYESQVRMYSRQPDTIVEDSDTSPDLTHSSSDLEYRQRNRACLQCRIL